MRSDPSARRDPSDATRPMRPARCDPPVAIHYVGTTRSYAFGWTSEAHMVGRFVTSFLKMPEAAKQQVDEALTMWAAEKDRIAEGGESATSLGTCGNILPTEAADMASELARGISGYYLCRNIDEQWSKNAASKQWSSKKNYCGHSSVARNWMATGILSDKSNKAL